MEEAFADKGHVITDKLPKFGNPFKKKKEEGSANEEESAPAPLAPGTCGELTLVRTEDRDAAMIMAIVADNLGEELNTLRFKEIKLVENPEKTEGDK